MVADLLRDESHAIRRGLFAAGTAGVTQRSLRGGMDVVMGKSLRGGTALDVLVLRPEVVVRHIRHTVTRSRHGAAFRPAEEPAVPVIFLDGETTLVAQRVMHRAQQQQVL